MTYPPYPQQPGGDGYQHPENDHGGYANPQYQQQQYSGMPDPGGTANGTGKLDFGGAIGFGFKAVFQQPVFWIGMTLLMGGAHWSYWNSRGHHRSGASIRCVKSRRSPDGG